MKVKGFSERDGSRATTSKKDEARFETLLPVYQWGRRLLKADSEEQICNLLGDALYELVDVTSLSVMLLDEAASCLRIVASRGVARQVIDQAEVKPGDRISGRVFDTKSPLIINRADQSPDDIKTLLTREELSASISFPLVSRNKSIGVINISHHNELQRYESSDIELVSILAQLTVAAIENIRLTRQKRESVRIRTLFEQYVSPDIARMLLDRGQHTGEIGTIKRLTVLFADIRNYTLLVQHLRLPVLREFLDDFFNMFTRIVYKNRGTLDKFMGDGALVIFGAPAVHENPAEAAVQTGKEVLTAFRSLRTAYNSRDDIFADIGLGIGISCGEMFLGNLGSTERFDYTVIGPDVNIAQRLASSNDSRPDGSRLLCTGAVLEEGVGEVSIVRSETMLLKGFVRPVIVHDIGLD